MSWHRLPEGLYRGPLVVTRLRDPRRNAAPGIPPFLECWALLDTGATHSIVDVGQIAERLDLRVHDQRRMAVAGASTHVASAADTAPLRPVYEVGVAFPDFDFEERTVRVSGMTLPGPFWMLIGMDLLDGTRLAMECRGSERWLRWEPLR